MFRFRSVFESVRAAAEPQWARSRRLLLSQTSWWFAVGTAGIGCAAVVSLRPSTQLQLAQEHNSVEKDMREEPITRLPFPLVQQRLPCTLQRAHHLMGVGVRQITIFKFNTYAIGMYLGEQDLRRIQASPLWKQAFTGKQDFLENKELVEDVLMGARETIVQLGARVYQGCASDQTPIWIVPARSTNGSHLKNGITRMLNDRLQAQKPSMSLADVGAAEQAIQELGLLFPKGTIQAGDAFFFIKDGTEQVHVVCEGKHSGTVRSQWLARNFVGAYLDPVQPLIPKAKMEFAETLESMLLR